MVYPNHRAYQCAAPTSGNGPGAGRARTRRRRDNRIRKWRGEVDKDAPLAARTQRSRNCGRRIYRVARTDPTPRHRAGRRYVGDKPGIYELRVFPWPIVIKSEQILYYEFHVRGAGLVDVTVVTPDSLGLWRQVPQLKTAR